MQILGRELLATAWMETSELNAGEPSTRRTRQTSSSKRDHPIVIIVVGLPGKRNVVPRQSAAADFLCSFFRAVNMVLDLLQQTHKYVAAPLSQRSLQERAHLFLYAYSFLISLIKRIVYTFFTFVTYTESAYSFLTGLRNLPMPSISASTTSPSLRNGAPVNTATPSGVPVEITSPGTRVIPSDRYSTS